MDRSELAAQIIATSQRLGIHPSDLATAISYETAGQFDPKIKGPTTQWGQHVGLIQAGEPQRQKYGINPDAPLPEQFAGIERYLKDAGVQPGMGLLDVYSAINAGRVGRYNASDANNGGAPGTVADKVASQMLGHRLKANQLLGLPSAPPSAPAPAVAAAVPNLAQDANRGVSLGASAGTPSATDDSDLSQLLALMRQRSQDDDAAMIKPMALPDLQRRRRARMIAAALQRQAHT